MANKKAVSYFWKIIERLNFDVQHFSRKVLACRQMMTGISEEAILRQSSCFVSCSIHQFLWGRCIKQVYLEIGEAPSTRGRHLVFVFFFFASLNFKFSLYLSCQGKPAAGQIELALDMKTGRSAVAPKWPETGRWDQSLIWHARRSLRSLGWILCWLVDKTRDIQVFVLNWITWLSIRCWMCSSVKQYFVSDFTSTRSARELRSNFFSLSALWKKVLITENNFCVSWQVDMFIGQ